ncbi:cupin domain-containing protein [Pseudomonas sp. NPDC088429]|uniref:cupin domain-containing protein n=1 Tax=Pseudomonas sp. NPDC088429 TaxID=3364455 RepID=UPI00382F5948
MKTYKKFKLNDDVSLQIISISEHMLTARFWFTGKGFGSTHHHTNEEVNVVINGEFIATNGDEQFPVYPGQAVCVAPNVEHDMRCLTPVGEMISTWTPPRQDLIEKFAQPE